jgi:glutamate 5-kinase
MIAMPLSDHFLKKRLPAINRIVIKVGTHLLRGDDAGLNQRVLKQLVDQLAAAHNRGKELILVTSGAVGAGASIMNINHPPEELTERQAFAAIGQSCLMNLYDQLFSKHDIKVAQILLTRDALDERQRYLNARNTLEMLLKWRVIPIINENDTVAVEEIKIGDTFGDNDRLSALIAVKMDADSLIILTDVDGLYDRPPSQEGAKRIPIITLTSETLSYAGNEKSGLFSLGGMRTKLEAVRIANDAGILAHINNGFKKNILLDILDGKNVGTWFKCREKKIKGRKRWLAYGKRLCEGKVVIDQGAERALLLNGRSLLPSGVIAVEGTFQKDELVRVCNDRGEEIARGLVQYSSKEIDMIKGKKTAEIPAILGEHTSYEIIHRNNLVTLKKGVSA